MGMLESALLIVASEYLLLALLALFLIIFAETGLMLAPIIPGDSLVFTAGALVALGLLNGGVIIVLVFVAAILGDALAYWLGRRFGERIFTVRFIPFLTKTRLDAAKMVFEDFGARAVFFARFVPFGRVFSPLLAGTSRIPYRVFFRYNALGCIAWAGVFVSLGFFFGSIPFVAQNLSWFVLGVITVSLSISLPQMLRAVREREGSVQ